MLVLCQIAIVNTITVTNPEYAAEHRPATGPLWFKIGTPDIKGRCSAIGWKATPYTGAAAKAAIAEGRKAAAEWAAAQVGDVVSIPVGYHPRHGVRTETYVKVR